jgi:hypothetical protein
MSQQVPRNMEPIHTAPEGTPIFVSKPSGERGHDVTFNPVKRRGDKFYWPDGSVMDWTPTAWVPA